MHACICICANIYTIKIKKKGDYGGVRGIRGYALQSASDEDSSNIFMASLFYCLLHLFQFYFSEINRYHRNKIKIKNHLLYASQNLMPLFIIRVAQLKTSKKSFTVNCLSQLISPKVAKMPGSYIVSKVLQFLIVIFL